MGADSMGHDASVHVITDEGQIPSSSRNCCIDGNNPRDANSAPYLAHGMWYGRG